MTTSQTTNLHLTKAVKGTNEPFSIDATNANLDTIDAAVGGINSYLNGMLVTTSATTSVNAPQNTDTEWSVSQTKSGYTPVTFFIKHGYSSSSLLGVEQFSMSSGNFSAGGYVRPLYTSINSYGVEVVILWVKDISLS